MGRQWNFPGEPTVRSLAFGCTIFLAIVLAGGWFLVDRVTRFGEELERNTLLEIASAAAASLDPEAVTELKGNVTDLTNPAFRQVRRALQRTRDAIPHSRFAYLVALRNNEVIFLVDAEPEDSPDYSPPGEVYSDASPTMRRIFATRLPAVEGPLRDAWGEWVSGLAPLIDPRTGMAVAAFGIDIGADHWEAGIARYRWFGIVIAGLIAAIAAFSAIFAVFQYRFGARLALANRIAANSSVILYRCAVAPGFPLTFVSGNVRKLGYEPGDFIASPELYPSLIHPDDLAIVAESQKQLIEEGAEIKSARFRLRGHDGAYRWFENRATPIRDQSGHLVALEGLLVDITEHKLAQEKIQENEATIHSLIEQGIFGVFVAGEDGRIAYVNPLFAKIVGYDNPADYVGRPLIDFVADADKSAVREGILALLSRTKPSIHVAATVLQRQGGAIEVLAQATLTTYQGRPAIIGAVMDITERKQAEEALRASEAELAEAQAITHVGSWQFDIESRNLTWSKEHYHIYGVDPATFTPSYEAHLARIHPDDRAAFESAYARSVADRQPFACDERIVLDDGRIKFVHVSGRTSYDEAGRPLRSVGTVQDITDRKTAEDRILFANTLLTTEMETSPDAILVVDANGHVISFNQRFAAMWNVSPDLLQQGDDAPVLQAVMSAAKNPEKFLARVRYLYEHNEEAGRDEVETKDGRFIDRHTAPLRSAAGRYLGRVWFFRDVTERKEAEAQILRSARHDGLTGLANRGVFIEAVQQAITRARRGDKGFAVLYIDLDHFKDVNDTLGHPIGDDLLKSVAGRLKSSVREIDTVARFGGDEFAVMVADVSQPADAGVLADALIKALSEPYSIKGNDIRSGASIGISVSGPEQPDAETLLSQADVALYRAKSEGRGAYRFFTDAMDTEVRTRVMLSTELRNAIVTGDLFLLYQPQVEIETGRITGVEALARWRHPGRGVVMPDAFIPVAETSGLILALGRWALQAACSQAKAWLDAGIAPPGIAVNLSGMQFKRPLELEADIAAVLAETGLPPAMLELELTETVLMDVSREHNEVLLRLHEKGVRLAIDDFGTGYSSLDYLRRFPAERIKIAQNFVRGIATVPGSAAIVKATIGLARELGIATLAEGVESKEQLELLRTWGCLEVQGFYFAPPLAAEEITSLLRRGMISPQQTSHEKNAA